ncbi:MAG TPA: TIGR03435 family protein [Terracidiphilus sp.]|nr:TIGR03435 family protein [Terracidiphilus sp.]
MRTGGVAAIALFALLLGEAQGSRVYVGGNLFTSGGVLAFQSAPAAASLPTFDAATIKPPDPKARFLVSGFEGQPGGRVYFGGNVRMLIQTAFKLYQDQVSGGPDWTGSQWFVINAVPPDDSQSRRIEVRNANATHEQRLMLQSLLRDRFGFRFHFESKQGEVYLLTRGKKPLQLKSPKNPTADPRAVVWAKQGGIADGEATGTNTTLDYFAERLSEKLQLPVFNQTGITGSYDFYLPPYDAENHDILAAVIEVVNRLGLKLKRGRGSVKTLVIDHIEQPSAN